MEPIKLKALLSAVMIMAGVLVTAFIGPGTSATAYQAQGVVIDFGDRDVVWTDLDLHAIKDPITLLTDACDDNGFQYDIENSVVKRITKIEINETTHFESDLDKQWDFWVIEKGELTWTKLSLPYNIDLTDYISCAWAYCGESEVPTVGVDQVGNSIFGYARPYSVISLSPSITEMIGSLKATSVIVGTDKYSNHPSSITEYQNSGRITILGDYANPSYEMIMSKSPDMVFCDGSLYSHHEMSERLRKSNVPTVVLYAGESINTIIDNIYIIGLVLGYNMRAAVVISDLKYAQEAIVSELLQAGTETVDAMISLSADKSPWVSGLYTYSNDIMTIVFGENAMADFYGWVHVTSAIIAATNPSVIIIIAEGYGATESEYLEMLASLSGEWKFTDAYDNDDPANSRIYMLCGGLAEMASRPGPRCMQLMEIIAMILHPDAFDIELPKYIGDDYEKYLTFTKYLGYND